MGQDIGWRELWKGMEKRRRVKKFRAGETVGAGR